MRLYIICIYVCVYTHFVRNAIRIDAANNFGGSFGGSSHVNLYTLLFTYTHTCICMKHCSIVTLPIAVECQLSIVVTIVETSKLLRAVILYIFACTVGVVVATIVACQRMCAT